MTRAWAHIFTAALLYAALQTVVIAWVIPTLFKEMVA